MELRHLRYLLAVHQAGSFRKAAELLRVAQPALSRQIQDLEREIGVKLFAERSRRVPTEAGLIFIEGARQVLAHVEETVKRTRACTRKREESFRMAFSEAAAGHSIVAEVAAAFRARLPGTPLVLIPVPSRHQEQALLDHEIDAGFLYPMPSFNQRLLFHELVVERAHLIVPRQHDLSRRDCVRLGELRNERLISISRKDRPDLHNALVSACRGAGFPEDNLQEAASAASLISLVAVGMGLGVLVRGVAAQLPSSVVAIPIMDAEDLSIRFGIAWTPNQNSSIKTLLEIVNSVGASYTCL